MTNFSTDYQRFDMGNAPVYGCEGCRRTGGRGSCYLHGRFVIPTNDYFKRCKNGHLQESPGHKYCPECGEKL